MYKIWLKCDKVLSVRTFIRRPGWETKGSAFYATSCQTVSVDGANIKIEKMSLRIKMSNFDYLMLLSFLKDFTENFGAYP